MIKQEAADFDNLTLYMATSLSFTVVFRVQKTKDQIEEAYDWLLFSPRKRIYKRWQFSNKGFRFCAGNFQTKDSDFRLAL